MSSSGTRRLTRRGALLFALAAIGAAQAAPAMAHADLRTSEPADGAVLRTPPAGVVLSFAEPMRVTSLRLLGQAGQEHRLRRESVRDTAAIEVRASIPTPLPPGDYRIEYRGLSTDGHAGGGAVHFRVEGASAR